ncbi:hypothetical protein BKA66DRAFT_448776 [Pyrenochaeta sp. MPI-SDFR-AT-0127]|nr:hypothetical protein BKA66DRAFT_448776 [Pyrenochaeta sp. MPI-SDFR-AT-0127]
MRLLHAEASGNFSLTEYVGGDIIPRYAILSHTWGQDREEVTFKDIVQDTYKSKAGYRKLIFCSEQAAIDKLHFFWVDTCCIDKSSSSELQESINSMFQWYQKADICYVYLSDVSILSLEDDGSLSQWKWEKAFQNSRWFMRGWTLQELLAPKCVEFFSLEAERLGDKYSLVQKIHNITGISTDALKGAPLSQFSIEERFSWAARRVTKREEDSAYSLFGIFDVQMPLLYGEGQKKAFIRLRKDIEQSCETHSPATVAATPVGWNVPFRRNRQFVGREAYLTRLQDALFIENQPTRIAITGLGGVGKTQIAIELAYRTKDRYPKCSILWLPASNSEGVHQAFAEIGQQLRVANIEEEKVDVKKIVLSHLSQKVAGQWLLIVDNVDEMDTWNELKDYLPKSQQGCILCTTRSSKVALRIAKAIDVIKLPEMDEDLAMLLLAKSLINPGPLDQQRQQQAAQNLLEQVTFLPLAIVQAAAYINENDISISDYLLLLNEQEEDVVELLSEDFEDEGRYVGTNPVATTWLASFEHIRQLNPLAAEYLSFMSCIAMKDIPQSLLPPSSSRKKETDAIGVLTSYSFVTRVANNGFNVHRLVHLATRSWLRGRGLLVDWGLKALQRLNEVFPDNDYENRSIWRLYLAHARYVLGSEDRRENIEESIDLAWKFAMCLHSDGRYDEAGPWFMVVMAKRKEALGEEHPDTMASMNILALTFKDQGHLTEAEELYRRLVPLSKRALGEEHPATLTVMNNLALTYMDQEQWEKAEELNKQVMEAETRVLGEEDPQTLVSINNLASTYMNQDRYKEAEGLFRQAMKISRKVLGEENPKTLISMNNLATMHVKQVQWKEAEELYGQVIERSKKVFGEEHPNLLISMDNLALTYTRQERYKEAEDLHRYVIEIRRRVLSEEHPYTLTSMDKLASTYMKQKKWKDAEGLYKEVIKIKKRVLSEEHPDTLNSMKDLVLMYMEKGQLKEADELCRQVEEICIRAIGEE